MRAASSVVCALALSCGAAPGEGPKAAAGYAMAEPVIAALDKFRSDHDRFPERLDELAPKYLPAVPKDLGYRSDPPFYSLSFSYTGPGVNNCRYTPRTKWACSGYY